MPFDAGGRDAQGLQGGRARQQADEGDGAETGGGERAVEVFNGVI